MRKDEDFDIEDGPSWKITILVVVLALMAVILIMVVTYSLFFKGDEASDGQTIGTDIFMEIVENILPTATLVPQVAKTPESEAEPTLTMIPKETVPPRPTMTPVPTVLPTPVVVVAIEKETSTDIEKGQAFTEVSEVVTAKEATNLRNMPSQGNESKVMMTLYNGQVATRIGISDGGWSKLKYDGKIYYAVSDYLTTDLTPPTPVPEEDGIKTVFAECNEVVTPKMEVNLRTLPSVTNPESVVVVKLPYGSCVKRTGINTDVGWSRVEYEGQVLYCVSSYVFVVEGAAQ